jgi:hypothetical protein
LVDLISGKEKLTSQKLWLDLLAHYRTRSMQSRRLPRAVSLAVFFRQASLTVREGARERARMSRVAVSVAPVCALFAALLSRAEGQAIIDLITFSFAVILVGTIMSFIFAQGITSLALITRRWPFPWQALIMAGAGSGLGAMLFLFLANQMVVGLSGGVIAIMQGYSYRGKVKLSAARLALLAAVLIFPFTMLVSQQYSLSKQIGYAVSAILFSCIYLYSVGKQNYPYS